MSNLLRVGSVVKVQGNSFYKGMNSNIEYIVYNIWHRDNRDIYSFKRLGVSGRGVGKSFSHEAIAIDNSIDSPSRNIVIVKK